MPRIVTMPNRRTHFIHTTRLRGQMAHTHHHTADSPRTTYSHSRQSDAAMEGLGRRTLMARIAVGGQTVSPCAVPGRQKMDHGVR